MYIVRTQLSESVVQLPRANFNNKLKSTTKRFTQIVTFEGLHEKYLQEQRNIE